MECPICGEELNHHDSFGYYAGYSSGEKCGDIHKCFNEIANVVDAYIIHIVITNLNYMTDFHVKKGK